MCSTERERGRTNFRWSDFATTLLLMNSICLSVCLLPSPFSKQEDEKGFITTDGGGGGGGGVVGELGSPESLPELERPPLRKIDQYLRPDCPCCNMTKRYTVAFLASIGIITNETALRKRPYREQTATAINSRFQWLQVFFVCGGQSGPRKFA